MNSMQSADITKKTRFSRQKSSHNLTTCQQYVKKKEIDCTNGAHSVAQYFILNVTFSYNSLRSNTGKQTFCRTLHNITFWPLTDFSILQGFSIISHELQFPCDSLAGFQISLNTERLRFCSSLLY